MAGMGSGAVERRPEEHHSCRSSVDKPYIQLRVLSRGLATISPDVGGASQPLCQRALQGLAQRA